MKTLTRLLPAILLILILSCCKESQMMTDGYIETINKTAGYSLNQDLITKVRIEFVKSKTTDLPKLILLHPEFSIPKTNNDLKNTDVLI